MKYIKKYNLFNENINLKSLETVVSDFKRHFEPKSEDIWGMEYDIIVTEPGNCYMVSHDLNQYLKSNGFSHAEIITININKKHWNYVDDGSLNKWHTAVKIDNIIIDLTSQQFKLLKTPKIWITNIENWKNKLI